MYLSDLTFIDEGNPDYLHSSKTLINFTKRELIYNVLSEIQQFQLVRII